jgi:acetyl-CoA C-acetyltransferase/3-oxo-5,6-didehydrosuberyl-CoA/3-oxoadipyl-CoA thiolase
MGQTAEVVAEEYGITREEQDGFALESQRRAKSAMEAGRFRDEIVSVELPQRKGDPIIFDTDEHPRPETTLEQMARLRTVFKADGTVTAANSSGINDGSAALLVVEEERAKSLGLEPLARVVASAVAGVEPHRMGVGPILASEKVFARSGWTADDLDLVELNEAFAAQAIPCIRELGLDPGKVNVNGGAIALGHPVGCSGARILTTLVHEMKKRDAGKGLASMCIGVGQGIATLVERT